MALFARLLTRENRIEFFRYFMAGGLSFAADMVVLMFLAEALGFHYLAANAVSVMVGITVNYLMCIKWVFTIRRISNATLETSAFVLICLVGLTLNELLLWLIVAGLSLHYLVAKVIVTGMVFIINYAMKKVALFS